MVFAWAIARSCRAVGLVGMVGRAGSGRWRLERWWVLGAGVEGERVGGSQGRLLGGGVGRISLLCLEAL